MLSRFQELDRRTGGLEMSALDTLFNHALDRRTGGLENKK